MNEIYVNPNPEKTPYQELEALMEDVQIGDPLYSALSDQTAFLQAEALLDSEDPNDKMQANMRLALVEEKMRSNRDNPKPWTDGRSRGAAYVEASIVVESKVSQMITFEYGYRNPLRQRDRILKRDVADELIGLTMAIAQKPADTSPKRRSG